jgi:hypothetical protein
VKQYMKNKRKHHYKNGWLDIPQQYAYLKNNASKRNPGGSRKRRALRDMTAGKPSKQARKGAGGNRTGEKEDDMGSQDDDEEQRERMEEE